ncbi:glycosyltransferase family 4 protein [Amylibacter sp.]|nr:glycosyltransferase family 4 protein [Amylibacter sp.]
MNKKIKIAAIFNQEKSTGGGFNECINNAKRLQKIKNPNVEIVFIVENGSDLEPLNNLKITVNSFNFGFFQKIKTKIYRIIINTFPVMLKAKFYSPFELFLDKNDIDLVYFLSPNSWSQDLKNKNYILTVWDVCHRDELEFPEVRNNGIFEQREYLSYKTFVKASGVIVDTEYTKQDLIMQYGVKEKRISIIPFKPSPFLEKFESISFEDILNKYGIENDGYIFYPAQFWPHKNHIFILDALRLSKGSKLKYKVVFCGGNKGNLNYLKEYADFYKLSEDIIFLDFVPDYEIAAFYNHALALVMPSYFGPSNLPPLEAFKFKTPVIYPRMNSFESFLDGACLSIDLENPQTLCDQIELLLHTPLVKHELIKKGTEKLSKINKFDDVSVINELFNKFLVKRKCWNK